MARLDVRIFDRFYNTRTRRIEFLKRSASYPEGGGYDSVASLQKELTRRWGNGPRVLYIGRIKDGVVVKEGNPGVIALRVKYVRLKEV
jgi:hypothetical protein